jgi:hypothetical protein
MCELGVVGKAGGKESEEIYCPYCKNVITRRSNGWFRTSDLSPDQEAEYNKNNPL